MQTIEETAKMISNNIRNKRLEKGLSQAQLAKLAGLHISTISRLESGKFQNIVLDTLEKIIKALHVSFSELFSENK